MNKRNTSRRILRTGFLPLLVLALLFSSCRGGEATDAEVASLSVKDRPPILTDVDPPASAKDIPLATIQESPPAPEDDGALAPEDSELSVSADTDTVTIRMVGDILLHDPIEAAARDENGNYDFSFIFDKTRDLISSADLAIVNQEVILGGEELGVAGYPNFNAPFEVGDALAEAGFDVILHATNHALDRGGLGLSNALSFWKTQHPEMTICGINESQEEQDTLRIVERKGIRVAVLNYTYGTNGVGLPYEMPFGVNMLYDTDRVLSDIRRAEEEADFTILCPHWGVEYSLGASDEQRELLELYREAGADLVLGCHPHVIEPIEWLEDEDPERRTNNHGGGDLLVYYSVGNFVSWTSEYGPGISNRMLGGMAEITIGRDEDNEVAIRDYGIRPVVSHVRSGHANVVVYPLADYPEELAAESEIIYQDANYSRDYLTDLCSRVWEGMELL